MFIHHGSLRELYRVAEQMEQTLIDLRLMPRTIVAPGYWMFGPREVNTNSTNEPLIKALMISGFYPNIAASFDAKMMRTLHANKATMSNQSINSINKIGGRPRGSVYTFSELSKQQGGLYMCRNTTAVSPLMVMLFGQSLKRASPTILDVDGWLQFRHDDTQHTETILKLKDSIDIVLANAFGELQKEHGEDRYLHHDPVRNKLVDLMGSLFAVDEKSYVDYLIEQAKLPQPVQPKRKNRKKGGYNKR
ncbi:hypothetical protein EJ08DRAFT_376834 [Tothia fuscella]|uniref:Uncharacterized protein n=1 Tax=Tothia fuscella TaxID=1048955 RepID=A0A9P4NLA9_9PEZI|nr:hypothetical protein EJ08DRAFT_376834 [Tothia fuscella]